MKIKKLYKSPASFFLLILFVVSCSSDDGPAAESEISKASGTYVLTEININPAQDVNEDGTASTNLLDELSCISGTLTLRADASYGFNLTGVTVTSITNGQFFIDCASPRNSTSNWNIQNGMVTLFADVAATPYMMVGETLTRTNGEDLPGIQSVVYVKQ